MTGTLRTTTFCVSITVCSCLAVPSAAIAQVSSSAAARDAEREPQRLIVPDDSLSDLVNDIAADFRRLPSLDTATLFGAGAAAAFFGHAADRSLSTSMSGERALDRVLEPGNIIGGFQMQLGSALATYTIGRITHSPRVTAVGADLLRAHIVSQTVTGLVKVSAQRTRPDGTNLSFPSGHTSASFATATVLQRHFGWKVGVPAMGLATYVAAARIHEKRHFLSDVAFGAAIGLAAGRTVTIGRGDRQLAVAPLAVPGGGGVSFNLVTRP
jgi:membrane-associated phospholipid phosphatase